LNLSVSLVIMHKKKKKKIIFKKNKKKKKKKNYCENIFKLINQTLTI